MATFLLLWPYQMDLSRAIKRHNALCEQLFISLVKHVRQFILAILLEISLANLETVLINITKTIKTLYKGPGKNRSNQINQSVHVKQINTKQAMEG